MKGKPTPKQVRMPDGQIRPAKMVHPLKVERHVIADALIAEALLHEDRVQKFKDRIWRVVDDYIKYSAKTTKTEPDLEKGVTFRTTDDLVWISVKRQTQYRPNDNLEIAKDFAKKTVWKKANKLGPDGDFIRVILEKLFKLGRQGNANKIIWDQLKEIDWDDKDWKRFKEMAANGYDIVGTRKFVQFKYRKSIDNEWNTVNLSFAK